MEELFWVGMYLLVSLMAYLCVLWWLGYDFITKEEREVIWAGMCFFWPALLVILSFVGVFKLYEYFATRKKTQ